MSRIEETYARIMSDPAYEQFAGGYANYGLWTPATRTPAEACQHLVDTLIGKLPSRGTALDVGFGKGLTTKQLCARYGTKNVVGINIGIDQIEIARERGVGCDLRVMDAAKLDFPSASFDAILCVESAFHFRSRADFLSGAYRALKPNGVLVMSDILLRTGHGLDPEVFPPENQVTSLDEYCASYEAAGFAPTAVSVEVSTRQQIYPLSTTVAGHFNFFRGVPDATGSSDAFSSAERFWASFIVSRLLNIKDCVLVCARK